MAYSKAHNFTPESYYISLICKALSHPARVEILQSLLKHKKANFDQLQSDIPLKQTTISSHIRHLRNMRIIISHTEKSEIVYSFNKDLEIAFSDIGQILSRANREPSDAYAGEILLMERMRGVKSYTRY